MKTIGMIFLALCALILLSQDAQKDVHAMATKNAYGFIFASWVAGLEVDAVSVVFQGDDGGGYDPINDDEYDVHPVRGALVRRAYDADGNPVDWDGYTSGVRASYTLYNPTAGTLGGIAAGDTLDVSNEAQTLGYLDYGIPLYDNNGNLLATASPRDLRLLAKVFNRTIQSDNFVEGVSGWRIQRDGDIEVNNLTARGDVILDADNNKHLEWLSSGDYVSGIYASADGNDATLFIESSGIETGFDNGGIDLIAVDKDGQDARFKVFSDKINGARYAAIYSSTSSQLSGFLVSRRYLNYVPQSFFELRGSSAYTGAGWNHDLAFVQTNNNTITTLYSKTLDDNTVYSFRVHIVARRTDSGTENGIYARQFGVYRQSAGGATLIAAADTIGTDRETTMAATITVDTSSNDIRVRVTGATSKTYVWVCTVEWQAVATAS